MTFAFQIRYSGISKLKQIESNRWEFELANEKGLFAAMANIPRAGAEAIETIKDGDVVVARIKPDSDLVIEILGVSDLNVWN